MRPNRRRNRARGQSSRRPLLLVLGLPLLAGLLLMTFRTGRPAQLVLEADRPGIGAATRVTLTARGTDRGLTNLRLELIQGDRAVPLAEREYAHRTPWAFWGPRTLEDRLEAEVGRQRLPELQEGEAVLRASARWLPSRGTTTASTDSPHCSEGIPSTATS